MVDHKDVSIKAFLLQRLREAGGEPLPGDTLAAERGVSRVAVWKQLKALAAAGYPVAADARGYRWTAPAAGDFLYPWEFGPREKSFHHWPATDSTMNRAAELALQGAPGGQVITAEEQTAGRGRDGRSWKSPRGGLFFTLLERPRLAAQEYPRLTLAVQLAAFRALRRLLPGADIRPRWPNDLYAGSRKLGGVLTEFHAEGDRVRWIAAGVGVNVNAAPRGAVCCAGLAGRELPRREVLVAILEEWRGVDRELRREWNAAGWGIGRTVPGRGVFRGIDDLGRALIRDDRGGTTAFSPGVISLGLREHE